VSDPCGASAAVAEANGAAITRCISEGLDVVIEVTMPAPPFVQRIASAVGQPAGEVSARARAGF
jgi:2-phosphoglycerate kinase